MVAWLHADDKIMSIQRLSILGVGLLGGSIGLAVKAAAKDCQIIGYGHRRESLEVALRMGAIDSACDVPTDAVREADLVILCTPVGRIPELLKEIAGFLKLGAIVTDVGSTKRQIVESAESLLPAGVHFVGSHPMAGSEQRGVAHADMNLFKGAMCLLTPTPATDQHALQVVQHFWQSLGMMIHQLSPQAHDEVLALISHLPHLVAAALMRVQPSEGLALAGNGLVDATRIASGDGQLWRDILLDNRDNVKGAIQKLRQELVQVEALLDSSGHGDQLANWLNEAAALRQRLIQARQQGVATK